MAEIAALPGTVAPAAIAKPIQVAADPLDEATQGSILQTSEMLVACTNALDTMGRLGLFSDSYLAASFAAGIPEGFAETVAASTGPLPPDQRIGLISVEDVAPLTDGRVTATVIIDDPANHFSLDAGHHPAATTEGSTTIRAQLILVRSGDRWLIDEIRPR
jgi:hypothetical protein